MRHLRVLLTLALLLGPAPAGAQPQPSPDEFVPISEIPPEEQIPAINLVAAAYGSARFDAVLAEVYGPLKKVSIDYALMEHAKDVAAVEGDFAWDDVGSWDALPAHLAADASGTISRGETIAVGCSDCLLFSEPGAPLVAAANCHGLTIVATKDAILVVPRGEGQAVKQVVDELAKRGRKDLL